MKYFEPNLEQRIEEAKTKAEKVASGMVETEEDLIWLFKSIISEYYKLPIYSEYFEERTTDQLAFEAHLIRAREVPTQEKASSLIQGNMEEAVAAIEQAWNEVDMNINPNELDDMKEFMSSGKFKGE